MPRNIFRTGLLARLFLNLNLLFTLVKKSKFANLKLTPFSFVIVSYDIILT